MSLFICWTVVAINTGLLVWYNKAVNADRYFVFIKGGT